MNLLTITILAAFLYIAYRWVNKVASKKTNSEIFVEELKAKAAKAEIPTPKKVKKVIEDQDANPTKPKRKYKKKPKV